MLLSNKCLDVLHWSTADLAYVGQYQCHGGANQRWRAERQSDGSYLLRNLHSNKCLDVLHWSTANLAQVGQYQCHGGANQRWTLG